MSINLVLGKATAGRFPLAQAPILMPYSRSTQKIGLVEPFSCRSGLAKTACGPFKFAPTSTPNNATRPIFKPGQIAHCARLANAPPSGPAWLLMAQMQGFPTHGVFLNPDRQPKGSTRPIFGVEREYGIRIGAWARENIVLARSQKNCSTVSGRSLNTSRQAAGTGRTTLKGGVRWVWADHCVIHCFEKACGQFQKKG